MHKASYTQKHRYKVEVEIEETKDVSPKHESQLKLLKEFSQHALQLGLMNMLHIGNREYANAFFYTISFSFSMSQKRFWMFVLLWSLYKLVELRSMAFFRPDNQEIDKKHPHQLTLFQLRQTCGTETSSKSKK